MPTVEFIRDTIHPMEDTEKHFIGDYLECSNASANRWIAIGAARIVEEVEMKTTTKMKGKV